MAPSAWHRGHLPLQIGKQPGPELGVDEIKSKQTNKHQKPVSRLPEPPSGLPRNGEGWGGGVLLKTARLPVQGYSPNTHPTAHLSPRAALTHGAQERRSQSP